MKKVLIITYYWPPSGGAGVQRWLKFVKYLPETGWMPVVVTVDTRYATYPVTDESLYSDVPGEVEVIRTRAINYFTLYSKDPSKVPSGGFASGPGKGIFGKISRFIRGNFFIPDPRRGWNRFAFRSASEIIMREGISHLITTSPPHSTQLIGLRLKRRFPSLKLIADLRDPWTEIYYYGLFYPTLLSRYLDRTYEKRVLKNCDYITTVGWSLGEQFSSKVEGISDKIRVIPNGYDESDFQEVIPDPPQQFTITFTGTLSDSYPLSGLVNAIMGISQQGYRPMLKFIGKVSESLKKSITAGLDNEQAVFTDYLPHAGAVGEMVSASLLLLVIADHPQNRTFLSGKLFEYIASGTPILCLGPVDGDAARILLENDSGRCFDYYDEAGIGKFIISQMSHAAPKRSGIPAHYSRRHLAGEIARLL